MLILVMYTTPHTLKFTNIKFSSKRISFWTSISQRLTKVYRER